MIKFDELYINCYAKFQHEMQNDIIWLLVYIKHEIFLMDFLFKACNKSQSNKYKPVHKHKAPSARPACVVSLCPQLTSGRWE